MQTRAIGQLSVGAIGLGCMGMSEFYGPTDEEVSLSVLERALELGVTMLDTADMYGIGHNERLLGRFFKARHGRRERVTLATKFGIRRKPGEYARTIDNSPAYIREACEASLMRLGIDHIDLYYVHRLEPGRPVEETVGALAELVREGKIRAIGLSEPSAATLERAHKVHPITSVESEYSLWTRDPETNGVFDTCKRLGIGFVAYSPLGRGFLTGAITDVESLPKGDFRGTLPRLQKGCIEANLARLGAINAIAMANGCTTAQVALAWVLAQPQGVVPIPGTKRLKYLEENVAAANVQLSQTCIARLDEAFPAGADYGPRYSPEGMKGVGG
jgi:aryl-alcohol dehydrogenase-like predicted oxidoreductase